LFEGIEKIVTLQGETLNHTIMVSKRIKDLKLRLRNGWKLDVLCCVETMSDEFTLEEFYDAHEIDLQKKHPNNQFVKDKIRQQLQSLKDEGVIESIERGVYRVIADATASRVAPVVVSSYTSVRPCTSYSPGDPKYKRASDFVDSPILSQLEKELLELIVNFRLPLANGEECFADILDDLEVQILDEEKSRPQSVDANRLRKKYDELMGKIERI
jgi:hypothetical protein